MYKSYSKASISSAIYTPFRTGLWKAGDVKQIVKVIDYAEKQGRPETAKRETELGKGSDAEARSAIEDVYMRARESCTQGVWTGIRRVEETLERGWWEE